MGSADNLLKTLFKSIEQAFDASLPNALRIPFPSNLSKEIEVTVAELNNDEHLPSLLSDAFSDNLYQTSTKFIGKNKANQVPWFYILNKLSPLLVNFKTLLFWVNQCLTYALNSPGISNDLVVTSRYFLKSLLSTSHRNEKTETLNGNLQELRVQNSSLLFKILLNIFFNDDINFYSPENIVTIKVSESLEISKEIVNRKDKDSSSAEKYQSIKLLESHEAKRFINLNIRPLLLEFLLYEPQIGFEVFDDYLKNPSSRLDTLSLVLTLISQESFVLNLEILKAEIFGEDHNKMDEDSSYFKNIVNAVVALDEENRNSISDSSLKNKIITIYKKTNHPGEFKINIKIVCQTNFLKSLIYCSLLDNDVIVLKYSLTILISIIPSLFEKVSTILPGLLLILLRFLCYNKSLKLFVEFRYKELSDYLNQFVFKNLTKLVPKLPSILSDDHILTNKSQLQEWNTLETNKSLGTYQYKYCGKLYTILYGLFPNVTLEFIKSPIKFFANYLKVEDLGKFVESNHLSLLNEEDIRNNSKEIAKNHLFNNSLMDGTVENELQSKTAWSNSINKNNSSELLWYCLKFDKDVNLKFCYPPDNIINQNILKMFLGGSSTEFDNKFFKRYETKLDTINDLFKLIDFFKVELYGFNTNNTKNRSTSEIESPGLFAHEDSFSHNNSNSARQNAAAASLFSKSYSVNKARKQSVVSLSNDSFKDFDEVQDIGSILNKQGQLFIKTGSVSSIDDTNGDIPSNNGKLLSPSFGPTSALNSPNLTPLELSTGTPISSIDDAKRINSELLESLKYYRRELLLLANDFEFSNMMRLMANNELQKLEEKYFTERFNTSKQEHLEILKYEDLMHKRSHEHKTYKQILKESREILARKKRNDAENLAKNKAFREEIVKLKRIQEQNERFLEEQNRHYEEIKKHINDKDALIMDLKRSIVDKENEQKLSLASLEIENVNNHQIKIEEKLRLEDFQKIESLQKDVQKLYEKKEFYKNSERSLKSQNKKIKKNVQTAIEKLSEKHNEHLTDLKNTASSQLTKKEEELKTIKAMVIKLTNRLKEKDSKLKELMEKQSGLINDYKFVSLRSDYMDTFVDKGTYNSFMETTSIISNNTNNTRKTPKMKPFIPGNLPSIAHLDSTFTPLQNTYSNNTTFEKVKIDLMGSGSRKPSNYNLESSTFSSPLLKSDNSLDDNSSSISRSNTTKVKSHANKLYLGNNIEDNKPSVHLTNDNVVGDSSLHHITPINSFSSSTAGSGDLEPSSRSASRSTSNRRGQ